MRHCASTRDILYDNICVQRKMLGVGIPVKKLTSPRLARSLLPRLRICPAILADRASRPGSCSVDLRAIFSLGSFCRSLPISIGGSVHSERYPLTEWL